MSPEMQMIMELKARLDKLEKSDRYIVENNLQVRGKVGFYGKEPVARPTDGLGRSDIVSNGGAAANVGTTYTGNTGTTDYSVGDLVYALKTLGLIT